MPTIVEIMQDTQKRLGIQPPSRGSQILNEVPGSDGFIGRLAERVEANRNGTGFVGKQAAIAREYYRRKDPARVEGEASLNTAPSDITENRDRTRLYGGKLFIQTTRGLFGIEMLKVGMGDDGSRTFNPVPISPSGYRDTGNFVAEDFDPGAEYKIRVTARTPDANLLGVETKIGTDSRASSLIHEDHAKSVVEIEKDGGEGWLDEVPHRMHMAPPSGAVRRATVDVPILDRSHDGIKDRIIIKIVEEKDITSWNAHKSTLVNSQPITEGIIIEFPQPDAEIVEYSRRH